MSTSNPTHRWRFFRSGGFDQVRIETAEDLRHLAELDQKLWAVLACPTVGLECEARTLQMIDSDQDGQLRVPELRAAVAWVCQVLRDPGLLFQPGDSLPLAALQSDTPDGHALLAGAREVLRRVGRAEADSLTLNDLSDLALLFPPERTNGDAVVPRELSTDPAVQALIDAVVATESPLLDRSGQPGVSAAGLDSFIHKAQAALAWATPATRGDPDWHPFGTGTADALAALEAIQTKVEDYFTRCQLAAFDPRAAAALNPSDTDYQALSSQALSEASTPLAALPLAQIGASAPLPLHSGLNPAWRSAIEHFFQRVVVPTLGHIDTLTHDDWLHVLERLAPFKAWQAARPADAVAALPTDTLATLLHPDTVAALTQLIAQDSQADAHAEGIDALEKLLRLRRDLVTLLRNFVNLADFYSGQQGAIFQAGTLYLDQRSCQLCLRVNDMGRHASLAPLSGTYLVYCQCVRPGAEPMTVVAALTAGDADDMLVAGRNGVFYDRQGRDWHASVVKVVEAPISVRQAFWTPYKRVARMVSNQFQKLASDRDKQVEAGSASRIGHVTAAAEAPPARPPAFDIAKFAGIFAAIGLALGAIGTALAALLTGFLALPFWQMPLVLLGLMLLISGPAMLLAWLKLRKRNLGPLLDANGWAVNIRARINLPFGASLTGLASLPSGAERSLSDPYAERASPWPWWLLLALSLGAVWWFLRGA